MEQERFIPTAESLTVEFKSDQKGPLSDKELIWFQVPSIQGSVFSNDGKALTRALDAKDRPTCRPMTGVDVLRLANQQLELDWSGMPAAGASLADLNPSERERLRAAVKRHRGEVSPLQLVTLWPCTIPEKVDQHGPVAEAANAGSTDSNTSVLCSFWEGKHQAASATGTYIAARLPAPVTSQGLACIGIAAEHWLGGSEAHNAWVGRTSTATKAQSPKYNHSQSMQASPEPS